METLYKLTRPDLTTCGGYQWALNEERTFPGTGPLCGPGWCHAYLTPELAVLLNPIHASYRPFRLFRAEGEIGIREGQLKVGCARFVLREECVAPVLTTKQHIAFGIFCARAVVPSHSVWDQWATEWLSGKNRNLQAAQSAAAWAAAWAAQSAAAWAAQSAKPTSFDLSILARQAAAWRDPLLP